MRTIGAQHGGVPTGTLLALMLAVFTIAVGYGLLLPLLPYLLERLLGAGATTSEISRNTGLLTATYTLALFLFAPLWGRASDRHGRRRVLLFGLCGFGFTMLVFSLIENLAAVYAERFLSGLFAAAVVPVASAAIGDLARTDEVRARRLTMLSLAGVAGFLLGPMFGVVLTRLGSTLTTASTQAGSPTLPLAATALVALLAAAAAAFTLPRNHAIGPRRRTAAASEIPPAAISKLLALSFVVAAGIGVFEVGLALRGKQELGFSQTQIALMFSECSLVMFVAQAVVFSPLMKPKATRWLIPPAIATLAAGLYLVPWATDLRLMLAVVGAVAASAGILSPILTFWISTAAGLAHWSRSGSRSRIPPGSSSVWWQTIAGTWSGGPERFARRILHGRHATPKGVGVNRDAGP